MLKENQLPEKREVLIDKLYFLDETFMEIFLNREQVLSNAKEQARGLLDLLAGWLGEDKEFALGTDSYTLADVIYTVFLARLTVCKAFFDKEVKAERPNVWRYW